MPIETVRTEFHNSSLETRKLQNNKYTHLLSQFNMTSKFNNHTTFQPYTDNATKTG